MPPLPLPLSAATAAIDAPAITTSLITIFAFFAD